MDTAQEWPCWRRTLGVTISFGLNISRVRAHYHSERNVVPRRNRSYGPIFLECNLELQINTTTTQLSRALSLQQPKGAAKSLVVLQAPIPLSQFYRQTLQALVASSSAIVDPTQ